MLKEGLIMNSFKKTKKYYVFQMLEMSQKMIVFNYGKYKTNMKTIGKIMILQTVNLKKLNLKKKVQMMNNYQ